MWVQRLISLCCSLTIGVIFASTQIGLVVLFLELFGGPTRRGYFCDDDSIKYPYKDNTVGEGTIVIGAIVIPLLMILFTEFWTHGMAHHVQFCRFMAPHSLKNTVTAFSSYILALGLSQIVSGVGKFTIGRLRPHFLAVCNPDVQCDFASAPAGYITNYTCTGEYNRVIEARLSFPSGHASLAFFASIYIMIYLQSSEKWSNYGLLRTLTQFVFVLAAWWVALTRVMDNWHHWSDVLAGATLGCIAACMTATYLPGVNPNPKRPNDEFLPLQIQPMNHISSSAS